jgi:hypothetical protein
MASTDRAPMVEPLDEHIDHVRGEADASVILEYGDYECPYSRQTSRASERVEREGITPHRSSCRRTIHVRAPR